MIVSVINKCSFVNLIIFVYIDPGSGSILLQFLFASAVGAVIYFRTLIGSLFRSMREKFSRKPK